MISPTLPKHKMMSFLVEYQMLKSPACPPYRTSRLPNRVSSHQKARPYFDWPDEFCYSNILMASGFHCALSGKIGARKPPGHNEDSRTNDISFGPLNGSFADERGSIMAFLGRKNKVDIEDFCKDYYDLQVYQQHLKDSEADKIWWKEVTNAPGDIAASSLPSDFETTRRELVALRLELFSLAWLRKFERASAVMRQSSFTKGYVGVQDIKGVWEAMGEYNSVIGQPSVMSDARGRPLDGRKLADIANKRADIISQWTKNGFDVESVTRVANRIWADDRSESGLFGLLGMKLAQRLTAPAPMPDYLAARISPVPLKLYLTAENDLHAVSLKSLRVGLF
jgi:hypothetical protein